MNQLEEYIEEQQFAAGSMLPKIEAAINFVNTNPKRKTIITSLEKVYEALEEKSWYYYFKTECMHVCLNYYVRYLVVKRMELVTSFFLFINIFVLIVHKVFMMKSEYVS